MTLIEVMIVIVIVALAAGGLSFGFGALTRSRLRSSCTRMVAAARFAYSRAIVHGKTLRIAFALPGDSFSIQQAHGRVALARTDDPRREAGEPEDTGLARVAIDPWEAAKASLEETYKPSFGASPFGPLTNQAGQTLKRYRDVKLAQGVRITRLQVGHEKEPLSEGNGAVHFFPQGLTEHAIIQLRDESDTVYSVEIHPLTGRAKVRTQAYEVEELLGTGAASEVEQR